jgi:hypothetical protein
MWKRYGSGKPQQRAAVRYDTSLAERPEPQAAVDRSRCSRLLSSGVAGSSPAGGILVSRAARFGPRRRFAPSGGVLRLARSASAHRRRDRAACDDPRHEGPVESADRELVRGLGCGVKGSFGAGYAGAAGPSRITARTWSTDSASHGNSTSHHVAPAAAYGAGSSPGGRATTTS